MVANRRLVLTKEFGNVADAQGLRLLHEEIEHAETAGIAEHFEA